MQIVSIGETGFLEKKYFKMSSAEFFSGVLSVNFKIIVAVRITVGHKYIKPSNPNNFRISNFLATFLCWHLIFTN